jgi:uncharacterized protein (TIGR02145 family)
MVQDYDGNYYNTIVIGSQEWTVENLKVKHYSNGVVIPNLSGNSEWLSDVAGAWCNYQNNAIYENLGLIYNWYAISNVNGIVYFTNGAVRQYGWRIPTDSDWSLLISFIGGAEEGSSLKEIGTIHWKTPNDGATDLHGFKGFGTSNRYLDLPTGDGFSRITEVNDWWSSSAVPGSPLLGHTRYLAYNSFAIHESFPNKLCGVNVRCVRDVVPITRGVSISHDLSTRVTPINLRPYVKLVVNPGPDGCYEFMDMFISSLYKPYSVEISVDKNFIDSAIIPANKIIELNEGWFSIKRLPRTVGNKVLIGGSLFVKISFEDHTKFYDIKVVRTGFKQIIGG